MDETELVNYIKTKLGSEQTVQQVMTSLEAEGFSQEQINTAFRQALHPSGAVTNTIAPASSEPKKASFDWHNFDLTKAFLLLGSILVLVALIIVIYSQWPTMAPVTRIAFLAVPMAILYLVSCYLAKKPNYQDAVRICLVVASLMLPFTIGTFLYQVGIVPEINERLVFCSAASAMAVYILCEYLLKQTYISILTVASVAVALSSFLTVLELDEIPTLWTMFVASALMASWGIYLAKRNSANCGVYIAVGTISALFFLPASVLTTLVEKAEISLQSYLVIISAFGLLNLAVASLYNVYRRLWQPDLFYRLKRFLEETAVLVILTPLIVLGFEEDLYTFVALVFSLGFVLLRSQVAITSLAYFGALGAVVSVIAISNKYFADSITWPIVVFIAGFVAIGLGLLIRRVGLFNQLNNAGAMRLGLGQDPSYETQSHPIGWARIIGLLLLLFILFQILPMLFWGLSGGHY